mmetsp:Transcript_1588/g.6998  ORF Transcript_1588/g.6998 Transcript_1588/m.6998 type:complete len:224 (-) Transcript_1588:503-1174(-)
MASLVFDASSAAASVAPTAPSNLSLTPGPKEGRCSLTQSPCACHTSLAWIERNRFHHSVSGGVDPFSFWDPPISTSTIPPLFNGPGPHALATASLSAARVSSSHSSNASRAIAPSNLRSKAVSHAPHGGRSAVPHRSIVVASRVNHPTTSKDGASGTHPRVASTRPCVGLNPHSPQYDAGTLTLPAVSVPSATSTYPAATATALPDDDPPGMRPGAAGFTGVP